MAATQETSQIVTPWKVECKGSIKYDRLINDFGLKPIDENLLERFQKLTGHQPHYLLTRGIFFAHQDLDLILDAYEKGEQIYLYTGRGPSNEALHLGHFIPMVLTAWLQKVLGAYAVIQMSDEEKYYFKEGPLTQFMDYTESNAKDIIACGFDPERTFIFSSYKYEKYTHHIVAEFDKMESVNSYNHIYGFDKNSKIGQISWPSKQMAPALAGAFPHIFGDNKNVFCLVPCAIDQAPYFRNVRDMAEKLGYKKPGLLCAKFLPSLNNDDKASTTGNIPALFLNLNGNAVNKIIMKHAKSGGGNTLEEHRKYGAKLDDDVPYIYLYHLIEDENKLKEIAEEYSSGRMLTGEIKKILVDEINKILEKHQNNRAAITPEIYYKFFTMNVQESAEKYFKEYCKRYIDIDIKYAN